MNDVSQAAYFGDWSALGTDHNNKHREGAVARCVLRGNPNIPGSFGAIGEEDGGEWRQREPDGEGPVVHRHLLGLHAPGIALVGASVNLGVAVQDFLPQAATWNAYPIIVARDRGEVEDYQHDVGVRARLADET